MGLDPNNIPETYLCEKCEPRKVDRHKAKVLQTRKKVAMTGKYYFMLIIFLCMLIIKI